MAQRWSSPLSRVPRISPLRNRRVPFLIDQTGKTFLGGTGWTSRVYDQEQDGFGTFILMYRADKGGRPTIQSNVENAGAFTPIRGQRYEPAGPSPDFMKIVAARSMFRYVRAIAAGDLGDQSNNIAFFYVVRD